MKALPFFIVLMVLIGGVLLAFQSYERGTEVEGTPTVRPTNTPRPRPTSPRSVAATATAAAMAEGELIDAPTPQPTATPEPPAPTATPGRTEVPMPTPTRDGLPTPGPSPTGQAALRVGNTGGEGVWLRRTPNLDDKIRPWMDGTPMVVIGPRVVGDGRMWEKVRAPDGVEGYIPPEYLVGGQ